MTPLSTSEVLGPTIPSATLIGTPSAWYMSAWIGITLGYRFRDFPVGWCATTASMRSPLERRRSASRTSAGPMSMPHIILEASVSRASSSRAENLQSE